MKKALKINQIMRLFDVAESLSLSAWLKRASNMKIEYLRLYRIRLGV